MVDTIARKLVAKLPPPGGAIHVDEIVRRTGLTRPQVGVACSKLKAAGLVEWVGRGTYRLTPAGVEARANGTVSKNGAPKGRPRSGAPRPTPDTLRGRLWWALRACRRATVPELVTLAGKGESMPEVQARQYLRELERGGYVVRLKGRTSSGCVQWVLVRDAGPLAPIMRRRRGEIYDPNSREAVPCPSTR